MPFAIIKTTNLKGATTMEKVNKTEVVKLFTKTPTHFLGITLANITDDDLKNWLHGFEEDLNKGTEVEVRNAHASSKYYLHFTGGSSLNLGQRNISAVQKYEYNGNIFIIVSIFYSANDEGNRYKHLIYLVPNKELLEMMTLPLYK